MKSRILIIALVLITTLVCGLQLAAADANSTESERRPPERVELEVLKVFSAKDGEAIFRAYLVSWKGQEVIVSDSLARSDYRVGEKMPVLTMNHPFPQGKEPHRLLAFTVLPRPR